MVIEGRPALYLELRRVIWFLRHGEAEDGEPDFDRRLTPKGERQAGDAGAALAALGVKLDLCLASPRVRARDTATLACDALGTQVTTDERLSGGRFDPRELAGGLDEVMLVGHEPDFSAAIHELTGARVDMKKGGLAAVEDERLRVLLRPKETRLIATVNSS
jgi:phosphohistidine phosphatase